MAEHDPMTHEEQLRLVEHAQDRMNASIRESLANSVIKDAILRDIPPVEESQEAS